MNVDPNITKYMIKAKIVTDGVVEKPDVVGAIFGQTEGLLGDELDLRDLQKSGKIGRIEVEIDTKKGRTEGYVLIPSGLDQVESSILAAALETIDRIGPCKAKVEIESIEDVRINKRDRVIKRAEELYRKMGENGKSLSESIVQTVREEVEKKEIISYGEEHLPAGPAIADSDSIIVVEGRNDVLNLLRYGIKNTIAVQGTSVPKTVKELSKSRTVTLFVDGDHGGDLIIKEMLQVADVDFIARAPPGTEVEELTYKQIIKALKYKTPVEQYLETHGMIEELKEWSSRNTKELEERQGNELKNERPEKINENEESEKNVELKEGSVQKLETVPEFDPSSPESIKFKLKQLYESRELELFDGQSSVGKFPVSDAIEKIESMHGDLLITGGIISQRLLDIAYNIGVKAIYGFKIGNITKKPDDIKVVAWDHI
ncbi:DNA primase DnaG [Picrophilus oshimae]|uniref:DNA primase DnaG n=1 Tax=Picrophilus torridus (strain ATCC 700027 / DSM 9790 / JCM 10055 / NBRC 100828 / KAW 2/3) TaxID=1122961 RepID=DNAG_PICTO|nr:DNA primase DnaG [Picrophilus oshimae]Q6L1F0.1 RecName: Full=DNA primase DnaG [Picrophilus oshimae DSM 9789]AAT43202.1 DNA primase [Picrophilus oshimae DSM 9789]